MIFPLLRFWRYTPQGFAAACVWNLSEIFRIPLPFAPQVFGVIMGRSLKR